MLLHNKNKLLNIIGLLFGVIGVVIIFIYGPPQPSFNPYNYPIDDTINQAVLDLQDEYNTWSKIGLGFIFVGFMLQLIAVIFSDRANGNSKEKLE